MPLSGRVCAAVRHGRRGPRRSGLHDDRARSAVLCRRLGDGGGSGPGRARGRCWSSGYADCGRHAVSGDGRQAEQAVPGVQGRIPRSERPRPEEGAIRRICSGGGKPRAAPIPLTGRPGDTGAGVCREGDAGRTDGRDANAGGGRIPCRTSGTEPPFGSRIARASHVIFK